MNCGACNLLPRRQENESQATSFGKHHTLITGASFTQDSHKVSPVFSGCLIPCLLVGLPKIVLLGVALAPLTEHVYPHV